MMLSEGKEAEVLVSVLCYNHEKYVAQCLDSIFMQQCDFEYKVFVFDDVSTDNSWNIVLEYKQKYADRMMIFQPARNGFSQGKYNEFLKRTFAMQEYKYVAWCEADDFWKCRDKLQKQYDCLEKNESCSMCVCATEYFDEMNQRVIGRAPRSKRDEILTGSDVIVSTLKEGCIFSANTYFLRNDFFKNINLDTNYWNYLNDDMTCILYMGMNGNIYYHGECMAVKRRFNRGSLTEQYANRNSEEVCKALQKDIEWALSFKYMTEKYVDSIQRYIFWRKIRIYYIKHGKEKWNQFVDNSNGKLYCKKISRKLNRLYVNFRKLLCGNSEIAFSKIEKKWMEKEWENLRLKTI